jgi:hypothetical protein
LCEVKVIDTDRELLELAAKAAGLGFTVPVFGVPPFMGLRLIGGALWNPLTDDGDAFRLAARLRMTVKVTDYGATAYKDNLFWLITFDDGDITVETAARRAIVRAAAEIGMTMQ